MRSHASVDTLKKLRFGSLIPALFTRMSTRPMRSAALATAGLLPTSRAIASQLPTALMAFSAAARASWLRPEMTMRAPMRARSTPPETPAPDPPPERAVAAPTRGSPPPPARPTPAPPPVIQAVFPFRKLASGILRRAEEHLGLLLGERRRRAPAVGEHLERLFPRRARGDPVAPLLEVRVLLDVHALALGKAQPRHDGHVGDGVFAARDPFIFFYLLINNPVEALGLVAVAVHGVFDLLGRVLQEVVRLPQHRPDVPHLEHHPLHHLPPLAHVRGQKLAGLGGEVEQHRAGLGERERLAAGTALVDHRGNLVVGRDREEVGLELLAGADVDRVYAVFEPGLLEHDVDLVAVRRRPRVKVDQAIPFTRFPG